MDKQTLELIEIKTEPDDDTVVDGAFFCNVCNRYYPIMDGIPVMLPDDLRDKQKDISFLEKWQEMLPDKIVKQGKPWHV